MNNFYTKNTNQSSNSTDSSQPAWLSLVTQLLQAGTSVYAAVQQANAQTGLNNSASQVPTYIVHQYAGTNPSTTPASEKKIFGLAPESAILIGIGLIALFFGSFYLLKN